MMLSHHAPGTDYRSLIGTSPDGAVLGFDIKTGNSVPNAELKGLRLLRDKLGNSFVAGLVLYLGQRSYSHEDRLHVIPLDRIWTPIS
jgi:hypothetical protein